MRILIVGAGTMGWSYAWLLSSRHDVTLLVRPERREAYADGRLLRIHDLRRGHADVTVRFRPALTTTVEGSYDVVLVMVDRLHLAEVLPGLARAQCPVVFLLNHWDLRGEVERHLAPGSYLAGFPAQVGGGRDGDEVRATVFRAGTVLGATAPGQAGLVRRYAREFAAAGLGVRIERDVFGWLKVHSLQQSLTAGPVLQAGCYEEFVRDRAAIAHLVRAFREGLAVCRACGVRTARHFPAPLFWLPTPVVTRMLQRMFTTPETATMVTEHMRHGLPEWIRGYHDVVDAGRRLGVAIPHLEAYIPAVQRVGTPDGMPLNTFLRPGDAS